MRVDAPAAPPAPPPAPPWLRLDVVCCAGAGQHFNLHFVRTGAPRAGGGDADNHDSFTCTACALLFCQSCLGHECEGAKLCHGCFDGPAGRGTCFQCEETMCVAHQCHSTRANLPACAVPGCDLCMCAACVQHLPPQLLRCDRCRTRVCVDHKVLCESGCGREFPDREYFAEPQFRGIFCCCECSATLCFACEPATDGQVSTDGLKGDDTGGCLVCAACRRARDGDSSDDESWSADPPVPTRDEIEDEYDDLVADADRSAAAAAAATAAADAWGA